MATFFTNEINSTGGDITDRAAHAQIMFPIRDKKCRVSGDISSGTKMNKQSKKVKPFVI